MFFFICETKNMRKEAVENREGGGGRGQRDSRGRSLEFMMRLESRFRLSEEKQDFVTSWFSLTALQFTVELHH